MGGGGGGAVGGGGAIILEWLLLVRLLDLLRVPALLPDGTAAIDTEARAPRLAKPASPPSYIGSSDKAFGRKAAGDDGLSSSILAFSESDRRR